MAYGPVSVGVKETRTSTTDKTLSVAGGYADAKAISDGAVNKIRLAGDTLTGDLSFSEIGDTAKSNGLSWNGSTDGADIYYQTTAKDQGNLVINLRDDSNCYLRIAKNGEFKSYFSPDDGNFHGNVNGRADTAGVADLVKSIPWAKLTGKPDVPSGGIYASGKYWIRFTDGTQIIWQPNNSSEYPLTWPVPFVDKNYVTNATHEYSGLDWGVSSPEKTATMIWATGQGRLAIGRWK